MYLLFTSVLLVRSVGDWGAWSSRQAPVKVVNPAVALVGASLFLLRFLLVVGNVAHRFRHRLHEVRLDRLSIGLTDILLAPRLVVAADTDLIEHEVLEALVVVRRRVPRPQLDRHLVQPCLLRARRGEALLGAGDGLGPLFLPVVLLALSGHGLKLLQFLLGFFE